MRPLVRFADTRPRKWLTLLAVCSVGAWFDSREAHQLMSDPKDFTHFGLDPLVLAAITEMGYVTPTPIQAKAIPVVLKGRDVMGAAQTGTGKTAGFALPIMQQAVAACEREHVARAPSGTRA